ncbi:MAP--likeous protein 1 [Pseudocercospora fuligena]|uniref:MAP--likeous protein 1 n=1 Tax=Pseudocercospora fuligena TaxID=685502 RepID=A0A8H6RKG5_9PEZI|nr:MAP--likeous protein 1 [Pseudocercospora fuligena]
MMIAPLPPTRLSSDFHHRDSKRNGVLLGSAPLPARVQNQQSRPLHLLCDEWDDDSSASSTDQASPPHSAVNNTTPSRTQYSWKPIARSWRLDLSSDSSPSLSALKMENVHGVDVSWLHNPKTPRARVGQEHRKTPSTSTTPTPRDLRPPQSNGYNHGQQKKQSASPLPSPQPVQDGSRTSYFPGPVTPPALSGPVSDTTTAVPSTPTPSSNSFAKGHSKRPSLLNRSSQEKLSSDGKSGPRRSSWISNISSKFSSSTSPPERPGPVPTLPSQAQVNGGSPAVNGEPAEPYVPSAPRSSSSSFFSNLTRKISANSQVGGIPKVQGKGGMCERRVLNVDPNRERCLVPEMDPARLRKVSFCVDVEIAGGPKYKDEEEDDEEKKQRKKNARLKERAEGEALKHPEALKEEKDEEGEAKSETKRKPLPIPKDSKNGSSESFDEQTGTSVSPPVGSLDEQGGTSRKKEKKKRSEEERKERKEKRRRRAEENGSIPVELSMDADNDLDTETFPSSVPARKPLPTNGSANPAADNASKRDRPTTDPVRIYRRCCQLRETPILKRITEQLMSPTCCVPLEPGVVHCLDLTGSRLQLADMITLGDWLAVVPVKKLLLEDADLSDEGLRCILAGLLAATKPRPTKRKHSEPRHRETEQFRPHQERSGVIEKLHLKNNPRITRIGWKHISLFLYMCRSIKAIDLSMIEFPDTMPASTHATPIKSPQNAPPGSGTDLDAAEVLYKCISQRLGGNKLEELIMSECGLTAPQIRKIVDGAIMSGINRLGFGGNNLDDEGLDHILHYLRSGVCGGLDLGGNDLRGKLGLIAEALEDRPGTSCWGLSFAGCNLDTASVKPLFSALARLPNFRFVDFSHNPDLCGQDNGTISLLRRYIGRMKYLKRIHLADVGMSSKQAIALADVLPEGPALAHVNILENAQLTALAAAKDEESQEEACALYASFMAAVRVSNTLICIDIDVPSADNSEVVKALAKQVVAYSLRNMERFAIAEATGDPSLATANAAASLAQEVKEIAVPDVLYHLVGHVEGSSQNHDNDAPAPDGDYIVGGTGVVKALQYVLGEKADDLRRSSIPGSPIAGIRTPRDRPSSSAGFQEEQRGKAKKMSKNLLESARKIRTRLQPALVKEATQGGDEMAYRRLVFLDQTLQSMISRFEEEYPETRITSGSPKAPSTTSSTEPAPLSLDTSAVLKHSDDEEDLDEEDHRFRPAVSRHNSDVSLASRALGMEEGHLHRLGQRMRREVVDSPSVDAVKTPWTKEEEVARLKQLQDRIESISGPELKSLVEHDGWDSALRKVGMNLNDLRQLQEQDPQAWEEFLDSQMKARMNVAQERPTP